MPIWLYTCCDVKYYHWSHQRSGKSHTGLDAMLALVTSPNWIFEPNPPFVDPKTFRGPHPLWTLDAMLALVVEVWNGRDLWVNPLAWKGSLSGSMNAMLALCITPNGIFEPNHAQNLPVYGILCGLHPAGPKNASKIDVSHDEFYLHKRWFDFKDF